jgi:WbqC-like protein family
MRTAIMQPYFLPYIGYFQLIAAVDQFVLYDNIKYTKKGWINRNRMLLNGTDIIFSLPLKNGSDSLDICNRELDPEFKRDRFLNRFKGAYQSAPYFKNTFPLIEEIIYKEDTNLFGLLHYSIIELCAHLNIQTEVIISSDIHIDHALKNLEKILALCEALGSKTYINAIGGKDLYAKDTFRLKGIELKFLNPLPFEYPQFGNSFVPWLSIVDTLMFNSVATVKNHILLNYNLI